MYRGSGQCPLLRSLDKLVAALNRAIINTKYHRVATIYLDISVLHFKDSLNPQNFANLSQSPFPVIVVATPAAAGTTPAATSLAPAGGALAPPAGTVPVTNIFNYRALPLDVRLWFDLHAGRKMMTRRVMDVEFGSTIPNMTLDPSEATMRTTLSYLDPPVTGD